MDVVKIEAEIIATVRNCVSIDNVDHCSSRLQLTIRCYGVN